MKHAPNRDCYAKIQTFWTGVSGGYKFRLGIKSFRRGDTVIHIHAEGNRNKSKLPGEIDLLLFDESTQIIWVAELKHLIMSTSTITERNIWTAFKEKYESQLERKYRWVVDNIDVVSSDFSLLYDEEVDFSEWEINKCFIVATGLLYSRYTSTPIYTLEQVLNGEWVD